MLLATKFFLPQSQLSLVARPRLWRKLGSSGAERLTLVAAPAGFGKTTVVAEWIAAHAEKKSAWLALDEGDNDPVRFLTYLVAALQQIDGTMARATQAMLTASQSPAIGTVMTVLINEIGDGAMPFTLVLDDYHLITAQPIHEAMIFLVEQMPPQMHLIITSRSDPPFPLSRWRVRRQLRELRADDLRFTGAEVAQFLQQELTVALPDASIVALERRTEGWIAGLQLAALSLQGAADPTAFVERFTGSHSYIIDYLVEEVLQRQPPAEQAFLLQTSLLNRLCGPLCDAVTGRTDGQAMLEQLQRANLFIVPLDSERRWYRYHHLFAEVLRVSLAAQQPSSIPALHRRAATWLYGNGEVSEAIEHAAQAADEQRAAGWIEAAADELLNQGQHLTLLRWLQRLSSATIYAQPRLLLAHAAIADHLHVVEEAERYLEQVHTAAETLVAAERTLILAEAAAIHTNLLLDRDQYLPTVESGQLALQGLPAARRRTRGNVLFHLGVAYTWLGQAARADGAYQEAIELSSAAGDLYTAFLAMTNRTKLAYYQGELRRALALGEATIRFAEDEGAAQVPTVTLAYQCLGELWYEWNELAKAEAYLQVAIERARQQGLNRYAVLSLATYALLCQAKGDRAAALAAMADAMTLVQQYKMPARHVLAAHVAQVQIWLAGSDLPAAGSWATTHNFPTAQVAPPLLYHTYLLARARVHFAQGDFAAAEELLQEIDIAAATLDSIRLGQRIRQTLCADASGNRATALSLLADAVAMAAPQGFVRTFVDEGEPMWQLLSASLPALPETLLMTADGYGLSVEQGLHYINKVLAAFPGNSSLLRPSPASTAVQEPQRSLGRTTTALIEPLSDREREVLILVAQGLSNRAVAEQLIITVGTVKRHLNNIFGKLGVSSRTQAIAQARELGYL